MSEHLYGFPTNEKVKLKMPVTDVAALIDTILENLGKLQEAFKNVLDHKYGPALAALLSVIQSLFVNQILPHLVTK